MEKNRKVGVVDYGLGNIGSIHNMLRQIGVETYTVTNTKELKNVSKIILPGVGHFDTAMKKLNQTGMADAIKDIFCQGTPILGICLGMQLMCKASEEGVMEGLGLLDANVKKLRITDDSDLIVPHMGWNNVSLMRNGTILGELNDGIKRYYFVHSYCVVCNKDEDIIGKTQYGIDFVSAFQHKNILGVQFHPEKSHKYGMNLLNNFIEF